MGLEFWRNRRVLLTGHTGFKGAWLSLWLQRLEARVAGIALPPNAKPSLFEILGPWPDLESRMLDIGDRAATVSAIESSKAEILIHLAAQSLVLEGHRDPPATFATNVMGTAHVLDPLAGYLAFAERLATGGSDLPPALNFGPPAENSRTVADTLKQFLVHFPDHPGYRAAAATGAHEATLLRLDSGLAQQRVGWRPRLNFDDAVDWTAGWYRRHQQGDDMRAASLDQLARYEALP